jgi:hypothetical protein
MQVAIGHAERRELLYQPVLSGADRSGAYCTTMVPTICAPHRMGLAVEVFPAHSGCLRRDPLRQEVQTDATALGMVLWDDGPIATVFGASNTDGNHQRYRRETELVNPNRGLLSTLLLPTRLTEFVIYSRSCPKETVEHLATFA